MIRSSCPFTLMGLEIKICSNVCFRSTVPSLIKVGQAVSVMLPCLYLGTKFCGGGYALFFSITTEICDQLRSYKMLTLEAEAHVNNI
jgi:hypothetical protein